MVPVEVCEGCVTLHYVPISAETWDRDQPGSGEILLYRAAQTFSIKPDIAGEVVHLSFEDINALMYYLTNDE